MSKQLNVRVEDELRGRVERACHECGQTATEFVRRALEAALGTHPAGEARPGVVKRESTGSVDDAPDGAAPPRAPSANFGALPTKDTKVVEPWAPDILDKPRRYSKPFNPRPKS